MITKDKKSLIIKELENSLKDTNSIVFVNFHKITVAQVNKLRRQLGEEGTGYKVAKKTLLKRVLDGKYEGELPILDGEIAIAYGNDLIAPARGVNQFEKENKGSLKIVGGVFEGKYMNAEEMLAIATIPTREVLLSQIAYLLKSPMQRLAIGVKAVAEKKAQ